MAAAGVGLALVVLCVAASVTPAGATASPVGSIRGVVIAHATGRQVAGATVSLPQVGLRTRSGPDGAFAFADVATRLPFRRMTVVATARGWGRWTIRGVPLPAGDTLELRVELRAHPWVHRVLTPAERRASPMPPASPSAYTSTCTGWNYQLVPTPTIKVWITDDAVSKQYDFAFYATHVLPNEWIPSWDADSLGAGAVAVKTYAGYRVMPGHAYSGGTNCADVVDGVGDQVFDPSWSLASTDQAVYATLGSVLYRSGGLFLSQYFAGAPGDPCEPVEGEFAGRMSQWGTQTCATESVLWPAIVTTFYVNTYWHYLQNLILDPGVESAGTYAWVVQNGIATRTKGGSFSGNWHWEVAPNPGKRASLREVRPFDGTKTTTYHAEAALRCGPENASDCSVNIYVVAIEDNGTTHTKLLVVTVPNDGVWRLYTYDPAASGFAHSQVKLGIVSYQDIGVDGALLTSAYGGP